MAIAKTTDKPKADKKPMTTEALFTQVTKQFGKSDIGMLNTDTRAKITHWASTSIYELDDASGWGLPGGRFVEWFGPESSGKTTELMAAFIENERMGGKNVCFDAEGTFDQDRYVQMGGNADTLIMVYPNYLEEFYDKLKIVLKWAKDQDVPENACVLIGVDTLTMIKTKAELGLTDDDELVAAQSRVNARQLPGIDKELPNNTCIILMSQVRDKVGGKAWTEEGNIDTPGGRIIKHICSVRVLFGKAGQIDNKKSKEDRVIIGMKTRAKVVKNKVGPPFRTAEFRIMFDHRGVDNVDHFLQTLVRKKLVPAPVKGVYTIGDKTLKAGDFYEWVNTHPKWTTKMLEQCYELYHDSVDVRRYVAAGAVQDPDEVEAEATT